MILTKLPQIDFKLGKSGCQPVCDENSKQARGRLKVDLGNMLLLGVLYGCIRGRCGGTSTAVAGVWRHWIDEWNSELSFRSRRHPLPRQSSMHLNP